MATYIEREAVRERACSGCTRRIGKDGCGYEEPCERLIAEFVCAPAADVVEVKHGRWEPRMQDDGYGEYLLYFCSECGAVSPNMTRNYCQNCGAKMDGKSCVPRMDGE